MSEPFDRKTLETTRDIIRETMPGNVAVALLISIFPDHTRSENIPVYRTMVVFICDELFISITI